MSDRAFIRKVEKTKTAEEILRIIVDNQDYLSNDPYYRDLGEAIMKQAEKILDQTSNVFTL